MFTIRYFNHAGIDSQISIELSLFTSSQESHDYYSTGPNVRRFGVIGSHQDLRCDVRKRAASLVQAPLFALQSINGRQTKIRDFQIVFVIQQQILRLKISVSYTATVKILHCW